MPRISSLTQLITLIFTSASFIFVCSLETITLASTNAVARPASSEVARAEKILAKLAQLDAAVDASQSHASYKRVASRFYPSLFGDVAELRDGDLKTDLSTAVFIYETIHNSWDLSNKSVVNCVEIRDIYREACASTRSLREFLGAKARLHASWATSLVEFGRGSLRSETLDTIALMRAARAEDIRLAERVLANMKRLRERVLPHASRYEYETSGEVAHVSFESFNEELLSVLAEVDLMLAQLPKDSLHRSLRNARNAFVEGANWWSKSERAESKIVAVNALVVPNPLNAAGLKAKDVNYTVVSDWRKATRALMEAEQLLSR